jgi:hypothetical protein
MKESHTLEALEGLTNMIQLAAATASSAMIFRTRSVCNTTNPVPLRVLSKGILIELIIDGVALEQENR